MSANSYDDALRASAYAKLEFPGTYYLAYRDLPDLLAEHVRGTRALDFGCGSGRSTRFLKRLGFETVGVDIAEDMIRIARSLDAEGDYRLIEPGALGLLPPRAWDVALSAFALDNVPANAKAGLLRDLAERLAPGGVLVNLVSSPEIYVHEWLSFSTKDYPENGRAKSGDRVRIVITDIADHRPVEDVVCSDEDYRSLYARAGLQLLAAHRPLGRAGEPYAWVNETRIPPWVIYILRRPS
jgi:SAM-dependent methyltransferase